ncbi:hypothetical protein RZS08_01530, partial [Arthrospira platensis SPKY1]|nr:hypothetical protein [Arthrospira platensis SPKY1]
EAQSAALNRQRDANDEVQRSGDVAEEAADRTESAQQQVSKSATSMFAAVRNAYAGMSEAMRDWYDGQLKRVRSLTEWYSRFNDIQFERHRAAFQGLADDADRLEDALR